MHLAMVTKRAGPISPGYLSKIPIREGLGGLRKQSREEDLTDKTKKTEKTTFKS